LKTEFRKYAVVFMLFVFMVVNFADKAVLGLVGVPLMKDVGLTPQEFGYIASSFFLLYSLSGVAVGFLANRVKSKYILFGLAAIWAVTQFPVVFWPSVPVLVLSRVLLGAAEGPAYPIAVHATYKWFPNDRRTLPTAILSQGAPVGVIITAPLLTHLIAKYSWHAAFIACGAVGVIWCILWLIVGREGRYGEAAPAAKTAAAPKAAEPAAESGPLVPYARLIRDPSLIGTMLATFAAFWILTVGLTWLPPYLQQGLGYVTVDMGWLIAVIVGANIPFQLGGSWLSQHLLTKCGVSSRVSRGVLMSGLIALGGVSLILSILLPLPTVGKIILLAIGCALPNIAFCIGPAIIGEFAPARQRAALLAINSSLGTTAGLIAPTVTGWFVGAAGKANIAVGYGNGYMFAGALLIVFGLLGCLIINPARSARRYVAPENRMADCQPVPAIA